jgi:hypothetical protein
MPLNRSVPWRDLHVVDADANPVLLENSLAGGVSTVVRISQQNSAERALNKLARTFAAQMLKRFEALRQSRQFHRWLAAFTVQLAARPPFSL